jgi:ABC-type Zn uptake system ZnuABC Zn-binding protein ZnuA
MTIFLGEEVVLPIVRLLTRLAVAACALLLCLAACRGRPPASQDRLSVVATTNIVGDVVEAVGGEGISLHVLVPRGADPHSFELAPQDLAAVADADLVFTNGVGLEGALEAPVRNAARGPVVAVCDGVELRTTADEHGDADPHVWFDPQRVLVWVDNIERALSEADPGRRDLFAANAAAYREQLRDLDAWVAQQVAQVPPERRKLVTDHDVLGYFAERYGFEQVGTVIPGLSTLAEPSAQEMAELEQTVQRLGVPAVFVGSTVSPALADRLAQDTGVKVVHLYTGSLSEPGGPADSYLALMRYDVTAIVEALR